MIPRLRAPFGAIELLATAISTQANSIEKFESAFAEQFEYPYGVFFPYGRTALFTLLKVLGWQNEEVAVPAYTCAVVAHAVKKSGNRPRFIDSAADHFNVSVEEWKTKISENIKMAVLTPLFGYALKKGSETAVRSNAPDAFILYDLAHGFAVEDNQGLQCRGADAALFGFGIGKYMSTIFGGMLILKDVELCAEVVKYRDTMFKKPSGLRMFRELIYGIGVYGAFRNPLLKLTHYLERNTQLLYRFTDYYYGKDGISFPGDFNISSTALSAQLGLSQLKKLELFEASRWAISQRYEYRLLETGLSYFDSGKGLSTYSHFPFTVNNRDTVMDWMASKGTQLGCLIDYSCPSMSFYDENTDDFRNADWYSRHMINLPNWPGITPKEVDRIVDDLARLRDQTPSFFPDLIAPG